MRVSLWSTLSRPATTASSPPPALWSTLSRPATTASSLLFFFFFSLADPFGHSSFQGELSSAQAGYYGVMWAREMIDFKFGACAAKKLERVWTPSVSRPEIATFQGIFVDAGYGTPGELSRCDYPSKPTDCNASKAAADAASAISGDIFSFRLPNVRGNDIILNFGGAWRGGSLLPPAVCRDRARRFAWLFILPSSSFILCPNPFFTDDFTAENAPALFEYVDALIAAFNSDPQQRFHAFYSTPSAYMGAKLATLPTLPVYAASSGGSADFFPYSDDPQGHNLVSGRLAEVAIGPLPTDRARACQSSAAAFLFSAVDGLLHLSAIIQALCARELGAAAGGAAAAGARGRRGRRGPIQPPLCAGARAGRDLAPRRGRRHSHAKCE